MNYSSILRLPPFRHLWLGQAISMLGDSFDWVTFAFMANHITGNLAMVGYVGAAESVPYLLLSPYAGVLADRIDRKQIMMLSDVVCALILVLFATFVAIMKGDIPAWSLLTVAASLSCVRAFFMPAKNAAIPNLVPAESLGLANGLNGMTQSMMPMIGLSISATVVAALWARSPSTFFATSIALNAVSFLVSAYFIAKLPKIQPDRTGSESTHVLADLKEGIRYVRDRRVLVVMLTLNALFCLAVSPFFVAYVGANKQWFDGKPSTLSWFECAFCAGMLVSSLIAGRMNLRRPGLGFIWSLSGVGLFVLAMAFSRQFWPFLLWNVACGLVIPFVDIPMMTWKMTAIPDEFRGRFNSLNSMLQMGIMPLGMCLGGIMVDKLGLVAMFTLMGGAMFLAAISGLLDREFRNLSLPTQAQAPKLVLEVSEPERVLEHAI